MKNKNALKMVVLLLIGGMTYFCIEILWRGYSHISMFFVGGICFIGIGAINEYFPWTLGIVLQSIIGDCFVTFMELASGCILNLKLGLNIWDYSNMPFNLWGQICLPFFFAWIVLSAIAIIVDDYLRYWLFSEERPHYKLI